MLHTIGDFESVEIFDSQHDPPRRGATDEAALSFYWQPEYGNVFGDEACPFVGHNQHVDLITDDEVAPDSVGWRKEYRHCSASVFSDHGS